MTSQGPYRTPPEQGMSAAARAADTLDKLEASVRSGRCSVGLALAAAMLVGIDYVVEHEREEQCPTKR